jgi:phosphoenolpyruvate-protein phosphotransferase (PTS system enzyme I)
MNFPTSPAQAQANLSPAALRRGIAVSPGVAVGQAYCIDEIVVNPDRTTLAGSEVATELARLDAALQKTLSDLRALQAKVRAQVGPEAAAIFAVHESILLDPAFGGRIRYAVEHDQIPAQAALQQLIDHYSGVFNSAHDPLLRERLADVRDVGIRLSAYLSDVLRGDQPTLGGALIVVADELLPSQVVALGDQPVAGIVTAAGGRTSHAAIVARSRGIPAVSGVEGIRRQVRSGDTIVVDGREGCVLINPQNESLAAYRKLEREFVDLKDRLAANRDQPAVTSDGHPLELLANINSQAEAKTSQQMGASGIGLYRTEYFYLMHHDVPDEEEQFECYRRVISASPHRDITIRTLDIGGDKTVAYLGHDHAEANPFMGWRSIRLSFEHPEFFATQIRAILRAAADAAAQGPSNVRIMFPMVTNIEELTYLRATVQRCQQQLRSRGVPSVHVPFGMMIEVPAAALVIEQLLPEVDFVSVGTNDLVQYMMAADRDNPKVSHLCQPLAPPILRVLKHIARHCHRAGKPVTICGEMAGQPDAFLVLLGMGLTRLSMSPAFIPSIKELAAKITVHQARAVVRQLWPLRTSTEVRSQLRNLLEQIAPNLKPLIIRE